MTEIKEDSLLLVGTFPNTKIIDQEITTIPEATLKDGNYRDGGYSRQQKFRSQPRSPDRSQTNRRPRAASRSPRVDNDRRFTC